MDDAMEPSNSVIGWLLTGVAGVIATLAGAVAMLWKLNEQKNARDIAMLQGRCDELQRRCEQCERDREELRVRLAVLENRINGDE